MIHTFYKTTNIKNGKFYIGVHSTEDVGFGTESWVDPYIGSGVAIENAVKKYGRDCFVVEIIAYFDKPEYAFDAEADIVTEEWLKKHKGKVYNRVVGGGDGWSQVNADPRIKRWRKKAGRAAGQAAIQRLENPVEKDRLRAWIRKTWTKKRRNQQSKNQSGKNNPSRIPSVKAKKTKKALQKYGTKSYILTQQFQEQVRQVSLSRYGTEFIQRCHFTKKHYDFLNNMATIYQQEHIEQRKSWKQIALDRELVISWVATRFREANFKNVIMNRPRGLSYKKRRKKQ